MSICEKLKTIRGKIILDLAGHVEYTTVHKPPEGYQVYRSERGRYFWVTGDEKPTGKFSSALPIEYKGERAKPKDASRLITRSVPEEGFTPEVTPDVTPEDHQDAI